MNFTVHCTACCQARLDFEAPSWLDRSEPAKALGWQVPYGSSDALCPTCAPVTRLLSYPSGEYNNTVAAIATKDGIEIEGIGSLDWEWIDSARHQAQAYTGTINPNTGQVTHS